MVDVSSKPGGPRPDSAPFPVCIVGDAGGVHVRTRALAMARLGHEVNLVTPRASGLGGLNESVPMAGRFANMPFFRLFNQAARMSDHARRLYAAPGDIVHVHYASSLGAWLFAASRDRRPLVVSVMGGDILFDEQGNPSCSARWLVRQVLRRADSVTAKSDYLVERLFELGVARERIEKVLWGVETDIFRPDDAPRPKGELGLPEGVPVIFSPRILRRFYRTDVLVRALPAVLAEHPEAKLVITEYEADMVYKRELETLAQGLGVAESIVFAGVVPHDRMAVYYNAADVAVGIPPSDGFPQTVLEAMACGTPNVVARLNRYEEILSDRESALFVDPTSEGVAAGILEILCDRNLADRLRQAGLKIVGEKAELNREAARVSQIYQRLHASGPRQPLPLFVRLAAKAILCGLVARNGLKSAFGGTLGKEGCFGMAEQPGTMKKAVFFDRDGVLVRSLIRDGKPHAARTLEEFEILPESGDVIPRLAEAGFQLVVFTNQPDVGNGLVERSVVEEMNRILQQTLPLTAVKVCYHSQKDECTCRKPKPGMLIEAAREFDLDLSQSYVVGDRKSDIKAGNAAGCCTIFIDRGYREQPPDDADKRVQSLAEARDLILALEGNGIE